MLDPTRLKRTPYCELLIAAAIMAANVIVVGRARMASDALFLEGMTLSIVGALIRGGEELTEAIYPAVLRRRGERARPENKQTSS